MRASNQAGEILKKIYKKNSPHNSLDESKLPMIKKQKTFEGNDDGIKAPKMQCLMLHV